MELADGRKAVVDPEVRAYVSSLVTAVSNQYSVLLRAFNKTSSLEEVVPMKTDDTCSEMMRLRVFEISRDG